MTDSEKSLYLRPKSITDRLGDTTLNVLVCGATGFIGRNIAIYLADNTDYKVTATYHLRKPFHHSNLRWIQVDLCSPEEVGRVVDGQDILVQAAAVTSGSKDIVERPYTHICDNAVMNSLLLRASYDYTVKHVIYFSCSIVYPSSNIPLREEDFDARAELIPNYFGAGWTKIYIEKMCEFYSRLGRTRHTVIRHSNVYGPHDKFDLEKSHVFGALVTKTMTTTNGEIELWGDGEEHRDLMYIDDLVDFVQRVIESDRMGFGLYNVGSGNLISVRSLSQKIIEGSHLPLTIRCEPERPTIKSSICLDCGRAKAHLGWSPKTDLDQGIMKTLDWYKTHKMNGPGPDDCPRQT